jgi:hypothetical protein
LRLKIFYRKNTYKIELDQQIQARNTLGKVVGGMSYEEYKINKEELVVAKENKKEPYPTPVAYKW